VLLVVNPAARRAARDEACAVRAFAAAGVRCTVARTTHAGHAAELAADAHAGPAAPDAVFTLGGDGTAMEVVGALAGTGRPVGIVPGGTGNLVARTLGIPLHPERAVAALLAGALAEVDLGLVRAGDGPPRHFAFAAGVGIDARMIERTPARWKRRLGVLAYALTAARAVLAHECFPVRVTVDGEELRRDVSAVMVVNFGAVLGDLIHFGPGIHHDDGRLDCCLFSPTSLPDAVRALWRLLRKDFREDGALVYRAGRSFRVETDVPRVAQADGELLGRTPLDVRVLPRAATLLVPRAEPRHAPA
jgi:YegS/Rv2252/BmrU family lipid kinase